MRGIPGSGKSTYSKKLVDQGFNRVNKDEIRYMINNYKLNNADEELVHSIQTQIIESFIDAGRNFVVDNTHTKQKYVDELITIINHHSGYTDYAYEIEVKTIDVPLDVALERNAKRENPVFEEVIRRMYDQLNS